MADGVWLTVLDYMRHQPYATRARRGLVGL